MCKKLVLICTAFVAVFGFIRTASAELVGYWSFDEGSGEIAKDGSGNGNDGTLENGTEWTAGKFGNAVQFDGTDDYVNIGNADNLSITDDLTFSMWVKISEYPTWWRNMLSKLVDDQHTEFNFRYRDSTAGQFYYGTGSAATVLNWNPSEDLPLDTWTHIAGVRKGRAYLKLYFNGVEKRTSNITTDAVSTEANVTIGRQSNARNYFNGVVDEVAIFAEALGEAEIQSAMSGLGNRELASKPNPANEAVDLPRDTTLGWESGEFAVKHDVYFGTSIDNVNNANTDDGMGVLVGQGLDVNSFDLDLLDFGKTYYWRVDEVNAPPDSTVLKGEVWSFTTEPVGYPVEGANITATASSSMAGSEPERTIDGSGLDDSDLHSNDSEDMWLSDMLGTQPTLIEYQFDKVYKLHEMWVWNSNRDIEPVIGYGFKDVTIEYSVDGVDYTTLGTTHEFARAPGIDGYAANTTVDFGGAAAKYVKLTVNSGWESILTQYGLSEVRFLYLPIWAREPSPDSGATHVDVDATLSFRAGREAARHDVYLSTDEQAVIDGTAPVATVTEPSYASALDLASTYYWRIDEANDAETPTSWQGDLWIFSTKEFLVVDDFESYNDIPDGEERSNLVYVAWVDGFDDPSTNGSAMGYTAVFQPTMETGTVHGGDQSVPLAYNNTTAGISEVSRTFTPPQNWTGNGIQTLSLWFSGAGTNVPGQLYVKINGVQVSYDGDTSNLTLAVWQPWNIDLASIGVDPSSVTTLAIGIQGPGATGTLLLDDIRLYPYPRQLITPVEPDAANLVAYYPLDGGYQDASGNNRHGTPVGGPLFVPGAAGQAMELDGVDDYVNIDGYKGINADHTDPDNPVQLAFTISNWVKTTSDSGDTEMVTWGASSGSATRLTWRVHEGRLRTEHNAGNLRGNTYVNDDEWHHVALVVTEGANLRPESTKLYVDGLEDTYFSGADVTYKLVAEHDVRIGMSGPQDSRYFPGALDEVRIYDRALTDGELAGLAGRINPFDKPF